MIKNSRILIWVEELLMLVVVLFGIWRVMTGAYIMLILVAAAAFVMYRQFIILQSFNQTDGEE